VAMFERVPILEQYNSIKCFLCGDGEETVYRQFTDMWYLFTFAGWLMMVSTWFSNGGSLPCVCVCRGLLGWFCIGGLVAIFVCRGLLGWFCNGGLVDICVCCGLLGWFF